MVEVFGTATPCSSTKGWTGHTLGASGILEAVIAGLCIGHGFMPGCLNVAAAGPDVPRTGARRQRAAPDPPRHEQCVRLRRHQLQPDLRDRSVMEAFVQGVSVWGPGLPGLGREPAGSRRRTGVTSPSEVEPARLHPAVRHRTAANRPGGAAGADRRAAGQRNGRDRAGRHSQRVRHVERRRCGGALRSWRRWPRDQPVSPTQFHNSVHNTAAGYWSIATGSQQPTTCLACHDATAAAALLKAMAEVRTRNAGRCCSASTTCRCRRR